MPRSPDIKQLETALGYQFKQSARLKEALTHRSASAKNNERQEFLGDSILNFVIAEALFKQYPKSSEGDLSRLRASLVNKDGLFQVSTQLKLGDFLYLGSGELKSGGYRRNSILADAVEAIFGAIYLDSDFETCKSIILKLYHELLENVPDADELKDPKTRLQELLQSRKHSLPGYEVINVSGQAHNQQFTVSCQVEKLKLQTEGTSTSRRKAEQRAARAMIELVKHEFARKD